MILFSHLTYNVVATLKKKGRWHPVIVFSTHRAFSPQGNAPFTLSPLKDLRLMYNQNKEV